MPWKGERDPYRIWLSEVMLQQTRVEQGLDYYNRFTSRFPSITDLALAPDEEVFKLWEGLGYYSRCKNLLATARHIAFDLGGKFPDTHEQILKLKGVGPYTAAAIASFAYNLPHAVIDGNVFRVLSRFFGINTPIDSPAGKKLYQQLADALLNKEEPAIYNQAIMDFGAIVCKPRQPLCETCVLKEECEAYKLGLVETLPVKSKSIQKRNRYLYYFILFYEGKYYIRKREGKDIWQNLHEWVLWEPEEPQEINEGKVKKVLRSAFGLSKARVLWISPESRQQLTHQTITGRFIHVELQGPLSPKYGYQAITPEELRKLAFPRFISSYLERADLLGV
ncbi:A/G-specific adenine glycosylase [Flavihumibacter rivuli]|nr:A/G-specific adenine glycosylase [Flavihumibacter rivuli]